MAGRLSHHKTVGGICPVCRGRLAVEHDREWRVYKPVLVGARVKREDRDRLPGTLFTRRRRDAIALVQKRQFVLSNRFSVKCHRPTAHSGSGMLLPPTYACCLWRRHGGHL